MSFRKGCCLVGFGETEKGHFCAKQKARGKKTLAFETCKLKHI